MRTKFYALVAALTTVVSLSLTAVASATGVDYGSLTSDVSTEIDAAVPVALVAVGLFIGIIMAYKLVRRLLRA